MTIEPHDITSVSRRPPVGMDKPRTLADYQADLTRRFGKVPSWPELAKRENHARQHRREDNPTPLTQNGADAIRAARIREAEATDEQVFAAIREGGSTAPDVATATGRAESTIRVALLRLHSAGRVTCAKFKRATIWAVVKVAAE